MNGVVWAPRCEIWKFLGILAWAINRDSILPTDLGVIIADCNVPVGPNFFLRSWGVRGGERRFMRNACAGTSE